jgi:hypothetical protein
MLSDIMLSAIMMSDSLNVIVPESHYVGCHYAMYQYAECYCSEFHYA